jgi:glycosyltransferase involved in cell wall biosynthesis
MISRILIISELFTGGGLERQIADQISTLRACGVEFFLATGVARESELAQVPARFTLRDLPLSSGVTIDQTMDAVDRLCKLVELEAIDLIHCHPFLSSLAGVLVAQRTGRPLVYTLHGPASLDLGYGQLYRDIVTEIILPSCGAVFCASKEIELMARSLADGRFILLPNSVDVRDTPPMSTSGHGWAWIGRVDHQKADGLRDLIVKARDLRVELLHVYGDGPARPDVESFAKSQQGGKIKVEFMGWVQDMDQIFSAYQVVAGMGRVAIEAMAQGRQFLLVGYDGVKGFLDSGLLEDAAATNFSGRNLRTRTVSEIARQWSKLRASADVRDACAWVRDNRNSQTTWARYLDACSGLKPLDSNIAQFLAEALDLRRATGARTWDDADLASWVRQYISSRQDRHEFSSQRTPPVRRQMGEGSDAQEPRRIGGEEVSRFEDETLRAVILHLRARLSERDEQLARARSEQTSLSEALAVLKRTIDDQRDRESSTSEVLLALKDSQMAANRHLSVAIERLRISDERCESLALAVNANEARAEAAEARVQGLETQVVEVDRLRADLAMATVSAQRAIADLERERAASRELGAACSDLHQQLDAERRERDLAKLRAKELQDELGREHIASRELTAVFESVRRELQIERRMRERADAAAKGLGDSLEKERTTHASMMAETRSAVRDVVHQLSVDDDSDVEKATAGLRILAKSRAWRLAKVLQDVNANILARTARGRRDTIRRMLLRLLARRPLAAYDVVRDSIVLVERWKRQVLQSVEAALHLVDASTAPQAGEPPSSVAACTSTEKTVVGSSVSLAESGVVSVVLPVYNQANMLADAINSVLGQTYPNWELIVVNDGSTDNFDDVIQPYLADRRIRVFSQPNQKLPSALNNGFMRARGEYLTWTSADNIMLPRQIEVLLNALENNPDAGLAYSDYEAIDEDGHPLGDPHWRAHNRSGKSPTVRLPEQVTVETFHDTGDNFLGASFLWRADVQAVVGQYNESFFGGEDYDYWLRAHLVTPFVHVPEVLYRYRVHANTLNARAKKYRIADNVRALLDADRARRRLLAAENRLATPTTGGFWRDPAQYRPSLIAAELLTYSQLAQDPVVGRASASPVRIVEIDVPLPKVDVKLLASADILITPDASTFFWLRKQGLPPHMRILAGHSKMIAPALQHAVALRGFEHQSESQFSCSRPPAKPHRRQLPSHVMVAVGTWGRGGMEQVAADIAVGLSGEGIRVTLAATEGTPNREVIRLANGAGMEVVSFAGDAAALTEYARSAAVSIVNYHHTLVGAKELKAIGIPTVYTMHNSYIWFDREQRQAWRDGLATITRIVPVSREVAQYAQAWFAVDPSRCSVIPNGIGLEPVGTNETEAGTGTRDIGSLRFVCPASFNRVKGQNHLVRAFAAIATAAPEVHLTLVGAAPDPGYKGEVADLVRQLGLEDRVTILDYHSRARVLTLLRDHDCLVLPSLVEGCSIALMEAVDLGIPAIATDVGFARDIAYRSESVLVVPSLAPSVVELDDNATWALLREHNSHFERNLAAAMMEIRTNRSHYRRRALAAKGELSLHYSIGRMIKSYLECFHEARA